MPSAVETAMTLGGAPATVRPHKKGPSQSSFDALQEQLKRRGTQLKAMATNGKAAGMEAVYVVETVGTNFLVSMAKGAWGKDMFRPAKIPLFGLVGTALTLWGLWDELNGDNGGHQIGFGLGMLTSDIGTFGEECGVKLYENWGKKKETAPAGPTAPAQLPAQPHAAGQVIMSGPDRELDVARDEMGRRDRDGGHRHNYEIVPVKVLEHNRRERGEGGRSRFAEDDF